jgi:hypothetical protein
MPSKKPSKKKKSASKMIAAAKKAVEQGIVKVLPKVTREEAQSRTSHIKGLYKKMGLTWWELGEEVERAVDDRVPEALGQSFSQWAEAIFGEGWLRIRRAFLAVKATKHLTHEKRVQLSEGNAYHFTHLPEKERKSEEWLKKAIALDNDAFKAATDKFIEKKTGIKDVMCKLADALGFTTIPQSLSEIVKETMVLAASLLSVDLTTKQGAIDCFESIMSDYYTAYTQPQEEVRPNGPGISE